MAPCAGLAQGRKVQILEPIRESLRNPCQKTTKTGNKIKGKISWRGKPGGKPRTAGTASTSTVADFWAARVWLRWERSSAAPCRYPVTAPEFRAHMHRRAQLPRPPRRRDRNI